MTKIGEVKDKIEYWKRILTKDLMKHPAQFANDKLYSHEHRNEYFTPENIVFTIKAGRWARSFGGYYSARIILKEDHCLVDYIPQKFRGTSHFSIQWKKIESISKHYHVPSL